MAAHIVLADDDPVVRHILGSILQSMDHTVTSVENGAQCIEEIHSLAEAKRLPSALFLDMLLGDMTGLDVLATIRKTLSAEALPVVMLSANTKAEMSDYDPKTLPEFFLEKPFTGETVKNVLAQLMAE